MPQAPSAPSLRDPLAEAGDAAWYVRPASGGQFGPAASHVMRTWLDEGRVDVDSLVWCEGWQDWKEAGDVFPQLGAGQPGASFGQISPGGTNATRAAAARVDRARARRQARNVQTLVIIVLVCAVVALGSIFFWVISGRREGDAAPPDESAAPTAMQSNLGKPFAPPAIHPPVAQALP